MKSILITGANRGLGLGIVKYLISNSSSPELIFAGYRDADKSKVIFVKIKYFY
jgi:NAD(P)-dependent dehydrogenase (short-subunit alcohol dehydrogenase family)